MEIELPDGTVLTDVPEGTTKAQIQRMYAGRYGVPAGEAGTSEGDDESAAETQRLARSGNPNAYPLGTSAQAYRLPLDSGHRPGLIEEAAGGAKHAWDRAALGLKGMFTELSPEDRALLEQGGSFVKETGPASTVGQIGADVLMSAGPVGAVNRGVQVVRGARALPNAVRTLAAARFTPAVADVAANAGYSAVTAPEDRGTAAAFGGTGATAGRVLNRALGGAVRPTATAQKLLERGVDLSPGQAGTGFGGGLARQAERIAKPLPIVGSKLKQVQLKAVEAWNEKLIQLATDDADKAMLDIIRRVQHTAPVIKRGGVFYPQELAVHAHRMDNPELVAHAKEVSDTFTAPTGKLNEAIDSGMSALPIAGLSLLHLGSAVPPAVLTLLSSVELGRQFLLGQVSWQKVVAAHPQVASQVARAMAQQQVPQGVEE